jgi:hypothetical protein
VALEHAPGNRIVLDDDPRAVEIKGETAGDGQRRDRREQRLAKQRHGWYIAARDAKGCRKKRKPGEGIVPAPSENGE